MFREEKTTEVVPCACCSDPSEAMCWQFELCLKCFAAWRADTTNPPESEEYPRRLSDEKIHNLYRARTAEWLKKAKAA